MLLRPFFFRMSMDACGAKRHKSDQNDAVVANLGGASTVIDVEEAGQCDVCHGSLQVLGLGDCPKCMFGVEVIASVTETRKPIFINDALTLKCEVCSGSRHIPGMGDCPKCMTEIEIVDATADSLLASEGSEAASSSNAIDVDASWQCDLCRGTHRVSGLGACPKCSRPCHAQSTHLQVKADHAVAELLEAREASEAQIRTLAQERDEISLRAAAGGSDLWRRLAAIDEDVSDEAKVRAFFQRRSKANPALQIQRCIKVENHRLQAFAPKAGNRPTLIFHGTPESNVGNIMVEGLLMEFCGRCGGIFGGMDPSISLSYAQKAGPGGYFGRYFMAVCLYDLALGGGAPQEGGAYSVPTDDAATVLWLLKVA